MVAVHQPGAVSPGLVTFGTLSLVNIGADPHRPAPCLQRCGQTNPFLEI